MFNIVPCIFKGPCYIQTVDKNIGQNYFTNTIVTWYVFLYKIEFIILALKDCKVTFLCTRLKVMAFSKVFKDKFFCKESSNIDWYFPIIINARWLPLQIKKKTVQAAKEEDLSYLL